MSLLDQISGTVIRHLSGADSVQAKTSATPSAPLGLGKGASFDRSSVDLKVGLSSLASSFSDSFSRMTVAVSGLQSSRNILGSLMALTDDLIGLAKKAGQIETSDSERARLNSTFQRKVLEFRNILDDSSKDGFDFRNKTDLRKLLKDAGVDTTAASQLMELFNRLAPEDNELGYTHIRNEDVAYPRLNIHVSGDGTFQESQTYYSGDLVFFFDHGDFNSDGHQDLVGGLYTASSAVIQLGNGDGTFQEAVTLFVGTSPISGVRVGDFDNDGHDDISFIDIDADLVSIFWGRVDGTFDGPQTLAVGADTQVISAVDMNGDDNLDIVFTDSNQQAIGVILGNGDRTFSAPITTATDGGPNFFAVADLNSDNIPDMAVAAQDDEVISIHFGIGDGTFQPSLSIPLGPDLQMVAIGDINNDGNNDIAISASNSQDAVWVVLGNGDGTFNEAVSYFFGDDPESLIITDVNGDDLDDLLVTSAAEGNVTVALGNANGSFSSTTSYYVGNFPIFSDVFDANEDGALDLISGAAGDGAFGVNLGNLDLSGASASAIASGGESTDPLNQSLKTQGSALVALNTLKKFRADLKKDLNTLDGVIGEVRGARQFALAGNEAAIDLSAQLITISDAAVLSDLLAQKIRTLGKDSQLAAHSELDKTLAAEILDN